MITIYKANYTYETPEGNKYLAHLSELFTSREEADKAIEYDVVLNGVKLYYPAIKEVKVFKTADEYSGVLFLRKQQAALAKLSPEERRILGISEVDSNC
jgi:hypothetical protein